MHVPLGIDGALGGDQRLADHLATEDPLPGDLGAATTIQIVFELFEVEYIEKLLHGWRHTGGLPWRWRPLSDGKPIEVKRRDLGDRASDRPWAGDGMKG